MKKGIIFASCLLATSGFAAKLGTYTAIQHSVESGKLVRIAINFSKCTGNNKSLAESMNLGVYTPNEIAVLPDQIAASLTHFTLNNPALPGIPVYEFVRYSIMTDNTIALSIQVLAASNYEPLGEKVTLNCALESAANVYTLD